MAWKMRNPSCLNTWNTKWVSGERPARKPNPLLRINTGETSLASTGDKVSDLINDHGECNYETLGAVIDQDWTNKALTIPIPSSRRPDSIYWHLSDNGNFNIKSAYGYALDLYLNIYGSHKDFSSFVNFSTCRDRLSGDIPVENFFRYFANG
ncbi:hypothetical protein RND81_03G010300 [Saponaria officinalis]|uniref:Uncharacterized protein n=1 Tax=Saponaria officinalis TaxID=3572 RepID=A0AAW1M2X3_SAPOF